MYEDDYRKRTNLHRNQKTESTKKPKKFGITGFQIIVSSLCIVIAVIIRVAGGSFYVMVRNVVSNALDTAVTSSQVDQAFAVLKSALPDMKSIFNSEASSGRNSSSGASSGSSSKSSGAASFSSGSSSASKGSSAPSSAADISTAGGGEGGEDLEAAVTSEGAMPAPLHCQIGPYLISEAPVWPVDGDNITSGFGYRIHPITKQLSFHTGIDIGAAEGSAIWAALPGVVEKTGVSDSYGNYVLLDHGCGVETFYAHCETVIAKQGSRVKAGDIIARVGTTGDSTGYHLHFEMRINNVYVNPMWALSQTV